MSATDKGFAYGVGRARETLAEKQRAGGRKLSRPRERLFF
jgi:hypothetical protein